MTYYDMLIDSIVNKMFDVSNSSDNFNWSYAKKEAHSILEMVEEFQSKRSKLKMWRASD